MTVNCFARMPRADDSCDYITMMQRRRSVNSFNFKLDFQTLKAQSKVLNSHMLSRMIKNKKANEMNCLQARSDRKEWCD